MYNKELINFADELVEIYVDIEDSTIDFYSISDFEKNKFAALFISNDGKDIYSCLFENNKYNDIVDSLINTLKITSHDSRLDFVQTVEANLVDYYENQMVDLLEERLNIYLQDLDFNMRNELASHEFYFRG